jgi:hypothetical protein
MGPELVEGAAADLEIGFVLIAQADVQTVAPLHFRSESEGQQPPVSCQRKFVIYSCFSLKFGRDGKDEPSKDADPASHPVLVLAAVGLCVNVDMGPTGGEVVTPPVVPPFKDVVIPPPVTVTRVGDTGVAVVVGVMMVVF